MYKKNGSFMCIRPVKKEQAKFVHSNEQFGNFNGWSAHICVLRKILNLNYFVNKKYAFRSNEKTMCIHTIKKN